MRRSRRGARGGETSASVASTELHSVVGMFEEGSSPEEIAYEYDSLELADVYAVLAYYLENRDAVNAQLAEHESRSYAGLEDGRSGGKESCRGVAGP